jgi:hypothetical protein
MSLSGTAMSGMNGTIYAPSALLSLTGSALLQQGLVVGMFSVSGPIALTQIAAGSDGIGDTAGVADTLLAGDLSVYIDDPSGLFTSDELARIQDAINAWDAILAPNNVSITEVSDPTLANVVIDTNTTSACGGMADGVLGCYNQPNGEITLIQGWNWFAGSDPAQIGAAQYDFETTVLHELGHALGLGGSTDPNSPMYETLAAGVADRTVTTQDLNIPDPPQGADPQMAAGYSGVRSPWSVVLGPLPAVNGEWIVVSGQLQSVGFQASVFGLRPSEAPPIRPFGPPSPTGGEESAPPSRPFAPASLAGREADLVVQGAEAEDQHGSIPWVWSDRTELSSPGESGRQAGEPVVQPPVDFEPGPEPAPPLMPGVDGSDRKREHEPVAAHNRLHIERAIDMALHELAFVNGAVGAEDHRAEGDHDAMNQAGQAARPSHNSWLIPVPAELTPPKALSGQSAPFAARLAAFLVAAGAFSHGAIGSTRGSWRNTLRTTDGTGGTLRRSQR